ncbi:putative aminopeptidase W07G4.4 isoform X2 [Petromyzon marinus]|uniref:Aminopeptidase W07G4.4 isoform X2 n=1 Tax=Petromyzon marinus TaxID=7757 RepID=A0AAJ7T0W7_PETMA|nr:putative aminopeptidase W07G4.4 isoform X2 [Petromyzon marinus]
MEAVWALNIVHVTTIKDDRFDGVVVVTDNITNLSGDLQGIQDKLAAYVKADAAFYKEVSVVPCQCSMEKRLVFSPTGPLNRDYDDVRRFSDAAYSGIVRALKAGSKKPLLVLVPDSRFNDAPLVGALGALHALYVPIEVREALPEKKSKAELLGLWVASDAEGQHLVKVVTALESGRVVYRDIGGSDPERMAAPKVAEYLETIFKDTTVLMKVISDPDVFKKEFPCLAAVNRCANAVERHRGRVIELEYTGEGDVDKTVFLVGKGITYDTGGADIKAGGHMAGMHRDKCGAAAVAGFFEILAKLKPKNIRVVGVLAMVRNSVGSDCYVADEIVTSRAGKRVRVGNTDAEGRMVMADLLCLLKEKAVSAVNPELYTIATLTGHAIRAVGPEYTLIMDNGPAREAGNCQEWFKVGERIGDPFELSTIRREDYVFHAGKSEYEDVLQCNNLPSSATPRGHQSPAAFLVLTSGMDAHGLDSEKPLRYSHVDIAGSSGPFPGTPTGAPIVAMAAHFLFKRL